VHTDNAGEMVPIFASVAGDVIRHYSKACVTLTW